MSEDTFNIPIPVWKHNFAEPLDQVKKPSSVPSIGALIKMMPMITRLARSSQKRKNHGFDPINMVHPAKVDPYQGVPLGGIGSGSIGRGWRGDFRRWQIRPGMISNTPVWADQFSVFVMPEGGLPSDCDKTAQVLFPGRPSDGSLSAWSWDLPAASAEYHALFPRAWTVYEEPLPGVRLTCRQMSPVIADNYQESSFPVAEFRWKIENISSTPLTVGLMFTFQNGMGLPNDREGGHTNQRFHLASPIGPLTGVHLRHTYHQKQTLDPNTPDTGKRETYTDPLSFAIAARPVGPGLVTCRTHFRTDTNGAGLWRDFSADGCLDDSRERTENRKRSKPGETTGAAIAVTIQIDPGQSREASFALAWDMPRIRSGYGSPYLRHYTRFYCSLDQGGGGAPQMACDILCHADEWETGVIRWQDFILKDESLPAWYRQALFNELYYLVDGGTIWAHPENYPRSIPDPEIGHFGYLEGHDYRMYNTYDVHFYASFALIRLWPQLELALQRDIAAATLAEYPDTFQEMYTGKQVPRKQRGAVPHDMGWPDEDPWVKVNGYYFHNVNDWKDLNSKFVLQIYRDFVATGDLSFVQDTWPAVEAAITRLLRFDQDGDGLIENGGFPDQTYDLWPATGPSAYTGGLWLAGLQAAACLADLVGKRQNALEYRRLFEKGQKAYEARLWNGRYFNYDASKSRRHDSIMADQLAGHWYARACGLPPVISPTRARSVLSTIYDWNVLRFNEGRMGAVNGMRPDGQPDTTCLQSQEVWTGTTYALAAAMLEEGMRETAFATAWGIYHTTYKDSGYWFQTPEAWDALGNYRALAYMRPLAIWAMQWALDR